MGCVCADLDDELPLLLTVNGVADKGLDSFGAMSGTFFANPFITTQWKNGFPRERRYPHGQLVEEWLSVYDRAIARADLDPADGFDALNTWLLPNGSNAASLAPGNNQFAGHVFCKRSWWLHVARQRYCLERAYQGTNLWLSGATPDTLADAYFSGAWPASSVAVAGKTMFSGKMNWDLSGTPTDYRGMLFPWGPLTAYATVSGWTLSITAGYSDFTEGDWSTIESAGLTTGGGTPSGQAFKKIIHGPGGIATGTSISYVLFPTSRYSCSFGSTITRPPSSLRNLFCWEPVDDTPYIRIKGNFTTGEGVVTMKLGFFWRDRGTDPALAGGTSGPIGGIFKFSDIKNSTILGDVTSTESVIDMSPILETKWAHDSGASNLRIPIFWVGPEYESVGGDTVIHDTGGFDSLTTAQSDVASTKHLVPWSSGTWGFRIGTTRYPFNQVL